MSVAVVTDSTAGLSPALVSSLAITVVPLRVTIGSRTAVDGVDVTSGEVAAALRSKLPVSTSRPAPGEFAAVFGSLLAAGASNVVSVHLSAALSGTWEAAVLASQDFPYGAVRVVDSRATAMAQGFAVLAAARCAAAGGSAAEVQGVAADTVDVTRTFFAVSTLEFLRRGGRIGPAASLFGTTLSIKPLLQLVEGRIVPLEKVRTSSRAAARLVALTVDAAGGGPVDLAVHHVAAPARGAALLTELRAALPTLGECHLSELGPVVGAHLGPGAVGTVIVRR